MMGQFNKTTQRKLISHRSWRKYTAGLKELHRKVKAGYRKCER